MRTWGTWGSCRGANGKRFSWEILGSWSGVTGGSRGNRGRCINGRRDLGNGIRRDDTLILNG